MPSRLHRVLRAVHKYAGLTACAWLLVLALTGIALDHHEWRWLNQTSVPSAWTSKQIGRLVPGTIMRHIAVADGAVLGASERGAWRSADGGKTWVLVAFAGRADQPQVYGFAELARQRFSGLYLATDDGLWATAPDGLSARRIALAGVRLTAISPGADTASLVAVRDRSDLLRIVPATGAVTDLSIAANLTGLNPTMPLGRAVMDLHFGHGLLPGVWSIRLNDLGGIAMAVLALTGLGYWWVTRRGRRRGLSMDTQRSAIRWLYRFHGPLVGLVAVLPILYLSVTAIPLNHIYGFLGWAEGRTVERSSLPPAFRGVSLDHEINGVAASPGEAARIGIATRFGLLESRDGGRSWRPDPSLPVPDGDAGGNLFRVEDQLFAGFGREGNFRRGPGDGAWRKLDGPKTAITGASRDGGVWYAKNSKAIFREGNAPGSFADSRISVRTAAPGTPLFLVMADLHAGVIFHEQFKWANDLFAALAVLLALSGPLIWLKRKWL